MQLPSRYTLTFFGEGEVSSGLVSSLRSEVFLDTDLLFLGNSNVLRELVLLGDASELFLGDESMPFLAVFFLAIGNPLLALLSLLVDVRLAVHFLGEVTVFLMVHFLGDATVLLLELHFLGADAFFVALLLGDPTLFAMVLFFALLLGDEMVVLLGTREDKSGGHSLEQTKSPSSFNEILPYNIDDVRSW